METCLTSIKPDISAVSVRDLLRRLDASGITVTLDGGDRLVCGYYGEAMNNELREELRQRKPEVIAALRGIQIIGRVRNWLPHSWPKIMTAIRHNQVGVNKYGESAETHPYAIINLPRWRDDLWDLNKCRWFPNEHEMRYCGYEPLFTLERRTRPEATEGHSPEECEATE